MNEEYLNPWVKSFQAVGKDARNTDAFLILQYKRNKEDAC
jgi:hypothetical protein